VKLNYQEFGYKRSKSLSLVA